MNLWHPCGFGFEALPGGALDSGGDGIAVLPRGYSHTNVGGQLR